MRDTLIWLTAKESAMQGPASNSKIILVSEDKAFWDKEKRKLDEGLFRELQDEGIPVDSITGSPTLQNVIENFVAGKLPQAEWVKVAVEGDQIADFTASSDVVLLKMTEGTVKGIRVSSHIVVPPFCPAGKHWPVAGLPPGRRGPAWSG